MTDPDPVSSPRWAPRIRRVAYLLTKPMTVLEITTLARESFGMPALLTLNTLAAGEGREFFCRSKRWHVAIQRPKLTELDMVKTQPTRKEPKPIAPRRCAESSCEQWFTPRILKQAFCCATCRQRFFMARKRSAA